MVQMSLFDLPEFNNQRKDWRYYLKRLIQKLGALT